MSPMKRVLIVTAACAALAALPAKAQTSRVQTLNFDLWCQETQHLPADRCDRRTAEDEAAFED
jgi:hypothetical protein